MDSLLDLLFRAGAGGPFVFLLFLLALVQGDLGGRQHHASQMRVQDRAHLAHGGAVDQEARELRTGNLALLGHARGVTQDVLGRQRGGGGSCAGKERRERILARTEFLRLGLLRRLVAGEDVPLDEQVGPGALLEQRLELVHAPPVQALHGRRFGQCLAQQGGAVGALALYGGHGLLGNTAVRRGGGMQDRCSGEAVREGGGRGFFLLRATPTACKR